MAKIEFEGLPAYAWPGGTITGTVVLEIDRPARGRDLTIHLRAREYSQTTVGAGKSRRVVEDQHVFLDQTYDISKAVQFLDPEHLAPGVYRAPFLFVVPPDAPPSLHTSAYAGGAGWHAGHQDGMYVEYSLEARLDVPWWLDAVVHTFVPVYSARRVIGTLPPMQSSSPPGHASVSVAPSTTDPVLPGSAMSVAYRVENPAGKDIKSLRFSLTRVVEYRVQSVSRVAKGPVFSVDVAIGTREPSGGGSLVLAVPNTEDSTGPWQGSLFRTYWQATTVLDVGFGFNVEVEGPMTPA